MVTGNNRWGEGNRRKRCPESRHRVGTKSSRPEGKGHGERAGGGREEGKFTRHERGKERMALRVHEFGKATSG